MMDIDFMTHIRVPFIVKVYHVKGFDKKHKQLKDSTILILHDALSGHSKVIESTKQLKLKIYDDNTYQAPISKDKKIILNKLTQDKQILKSFKFIRQAYYYQDFVCEIYTEDDVFKIWIGNDSYSKSLTKIDADLLKAFYNAYPGNYFYGNKNEELNQLVTLDLSLGLKQDYAFTYANEYSKDLDAYRYIFAEESRIKKINPDTITVHSTKLYEYFGDYKAILKIIDHENSKVLIPYKVKFDIQKVGMITLHACIEIKPKDLIIDEFLKLIKPKQSTYDMKDKYYIAVAKGGHVGREYFIRISLPIIAINGKEAALKARNTPRVKHHSENAVFSCDEVSYDMYLKQKAANEQDPYFRCTNSSEQKLYDEEIHARREKEVKDESL